MNNLPFSLQFTDFTVRGQMIDTNLIDILQSSKEFITGNDLLFLTNNYHFAGVFIRAYEICPLLNEEIGK